MQPGRSLSLSPQAFPLPPPRWCPTTAPRSGSRTAGRQPTAITFGAGRPGLVQAGSVAEDLAQEQLGPLGARIGEELGRRGLLDDLALVHEHHSVRDRS